MNNIQVYLFEILCLGKCLPGGESGVSWLLAGLNVECLKGDTQHSKPVIVGIWNTPTPTLPPPSSPSAKAHAIPNLCHIVP